MLSTSLLSKSALADCNSESFMIAVVLAVEELPVIGVAVALVLAVLLDWLENRKYQIPPATRTIIKIAIKTQVSLLFDFGCS